MKQKPSHWDQKKADAFTDLSIIEHYSNRPDYPIDLIEKLQSLITSKTRTALDIGCGMGDVARNLVSDTFRVDAVDISLPMIENGKKLPQGNHPNLSWIHSAIETAPLNPPYSLVSAGESLHWMDWETVCRRITEILVPGGKMAIISRGWGTGEPAEGELYARYSTTKDFKLMDLPSELEKRGLFRIESRQLFATDWQPTIDEFISSRHSQSQFSYERMTPKNAAEFDKSLRELLIQLNKENKIGMENECLLHKSRVYLTLGEPLTQ